MAKYFYADTQIEDLWLNFFCVSTNLSTGEKVVHRTGDLWKAIRATSSAPGILAPVIDRGQLLVDGASVDNDPSMTMRELNPGPIVLSVIAPPSDRKIPFTYEEFPSPWKILWSWVNPFVKQIEFPNLAEILMMSIVVNSIYNRDKSLAVADLMLTPPLESYNIFDFKAMDEMIQVACEYSLEKLKDWSPFPSQVSDGNMLAKEKGVAQLRDDGHSWRSIKHRLQASFSYVPKRASSPKCATPGKGLMMLDVHGERASKKTSEAETLPLGLT
ncbi:MAG: patatin-like phospholipase family protein [Hormoscilla sp. GM7CHS1pb]|nr:patatin-like phospholipase family protein [Hormoscilla sp. GM7CHS1pb]